ncbi:MAG: SGNH/GDSL hydrolase family protein [Candidatus Peregrinibacteria bacterium]|nr:SGNH/GDSL hydrolase family protein [Candidatus Peregrinibacteria bacterium]
MSYKSKIEESIAGRDAGTGANAYPTTKLGEDLDLSTYFDDLNIIEDPFFSNGIPIDLIKDGVGTYSIDATAYNSFGKSLKIEAATNLQLYFDIKKYQFVAGDQVSVEWYMYSLGDASAVQSWAALRYGASTFQDYSYTTTALGGGWFKRVDTMTLTEAHLLASNLRIGVLVNNLTILGVNPLYITNFTIKLPKTAYLFIPVLQKLKLIFSDIKSFKIKYVNCIGDSLTQGDFGGGGAYPELLQPKIPQYTVRNLGIGGEQTTCVLGRVGYLGFKLKNTITLPADTSVQNIGTLADSGILSCYDDSNMQPLQQGNSGMEYVVIDGVECTLAYVNPNYTIKRNAAGVSRILYAGTQIITKGAKVYAKDAINIFYTGTNDTTTTGAVLADKLIKAESFVKKGNNIIVGLHHNDGNTYANVDIINNELKKVFGLRFIDMKRYLLGNALFDMGIEPTAQDLIDIAAGKAPLSLRYDAIHLNITGRQAVANKIYETLVNLNYL